MDVVAELDAIKAQLIQYQTSSEVCLSTGRVDLDPAKSWELSQAISRPNVAFVQEFARAVEVPKLGTEKGGDFCHADRVAVCVYGVNDVPFLSEQGFSLQSLVVRS